MTMPKIGPGFRALLAVGVFLLGGCTIGVQPHQQAAATSKSAAKASAPSWKSEISDVKSQIKKASGNQSRALSGVEHRLSLLEKEVNELRGSLEVVQHENQKLKSRLSKFEMVEPAPAATAASQPAEIIAGPVTTPTDPQPAQEEIKPLATQSEIAASMEPAKEPEAVPAAPEPITPAAPPPPPVSARELYDKAHQKILTRQFADSLVEFKQFLELYPDHDLADNAQYWIGELLYVQKQYLESLQAFNTVLVRWPASPKVPGCLLKIGFAFYELGDMENARTSLTRLVTDFPLSTPVSLAKKRLALIEERIGQQ